MTFGGPLGLLALGAVAPLLLAYFLRPWVIRMIQRPNKSANA